MRENDKEKEVYLDNGSTSFPKAPGIGKAMADYLEFRGCNVGRGNYRWGYAVAEAVFKTRQKLCRLFDFNEGADPTKNVIFTSGVTESLNLVIKGLLKSGDHVLVSGLEHNAVMRPLHFLRKSGVTYDVVPCNRQGVLDLKVLEAMIKKNTRAVVMTHASNVCGTLLPIDAIGELCRSYKLKFVLDAAQTAGVIPISMSKTAVDALCFTGHKGLLGPQGIGGVIMNDEMAFQLTELIHGGTGSFSESIEMPDFLPDKFESGTLNIPGIYGLSKALDYLAEISLKAIFKKEMALTESFISGIMKLEGLKLVGIPDIDGRTAVISLVSTKKDNALVAFELDQLYGIMTRVGLHCAPLAHQTLGTFPGGTLRISFGHFNNQDDVAYCLEALKRILSR